MLEIAQWVAPVATMIAAIMTAANLGARVTGWGFVVFLFGSLGWIVVGLGNDETSLIVANSFLSLVNAIGIWRWLGRQAKYQAVGEAAEIAGQAARTASVVAASSLFGRAVIDTEGTRIAEAVEAIIDCRTAAIEHLVVRFGGVGGIGERIVAVPIADIRLDDDAISTRLTGAALAELPRLDARQWPRLLATPAGRISAAAG